MPRDNFIPNWDYAPDGWDWLAQDKDGKWYWYGKEPIAGVEGGIWRSNSRVQQYAGQSEPKDDWLNTLFKRPNLPNV